MQINELKRNYIYHGDSLETLKTFPSSAFDVCVCSPPYYSLREYDAFGQLGWEKTDEEYINKLCEIFSEVHRVLKDSGVLWLNIGDCYNDGDLRLIPARVALKLKSNQFHKFTLLNEIIWHKQSKAPTSFINRCHSEHESIFLFAKDPSKDIINLRNYLLKFKDPDWAIKAYKSARRRESGNTISRRKYKKTGASEDTSNSFKTIPQGKMLGDVWILKHSGIKEAHIAPFPKELVRRALSLSTNLAGVCKRCGIPWRDAYKRMAIPGNDDLKQIVKYGSKPKCNCVNHIINDLKCGKFEDPLSFGKIELDRFLVLDPFMGSGTTALVAQELGIDYVGIELGEEYIKMAEKRLKKQGLGLFTK